MKLFLLLLFFIFHVSKSTFVITWGKLTDHIGCDLMEHEACFEQCEENSSCLIAHVNESVCYNCGSGFSSTIQSLDRSQASGNKVGFKVLNITGECRASPNSTFEAESFTLEYSYDHWKIIPKINTATITTDDERCNFRGRIFDRNGFEWCIVVELSDNLKDNEIAGLCDKSCGYGSGMATPQERDYIIASAKEQFKLNNFTTSALWINIYRYPDCPCDSPPEYCLPAVPNSFYSSDENEKYMINQTQWVTDSPICSDTENTPKCVQLIIDMEDGKSGGLKEVDCKISVPKNSINYIRGTVCKYISGTCI